MNTGKTDMEIIKVEVKTLTGDALAYAFAEATGKLEGMFPDRVQGLARLGSFCRLQTKQVSDPASLMALFPAYDLHVEHCKARTEGFRVRVVADDQRARDPSKPTFGRVTASGPDATTAIMRAVVTAHVGDMVEVPAVLVDA